MTAQPEWRLTIYYVVTKEIPVKPNVSEFNLALFLKFSLRYVDVNSSEKLAVIFKYVKV